MSTVVAWCWYGNKFRHLTASDDVSLVYGFERALTGELAPETGEQGCHRRCFVAGAHYLTPKRLYKGVSWGVGGKF